MQIKNSKGLICVLIVVMLVLPANALQPGDPIGWVLHTDIVAYIDDRPIRSYNINGYTYVVAEELAEYGFSVEWSERGDGVLSIGARDREITSDYVPEDNAHRAGKPALPYYYTRILTYMGDNRSMASISAAKPVSVWMIWRHLSLRNMYGFRKSGNCV